MSQPDRDEPRQFRLFATEPCTGARVELRPPGWWADESGGHDGYWRAESGAAVIAAYMAAYPNRHPDAKPYQHFEVVESRGPFPSDEDVEALNELLRHSPVEGGLVEKVRWLIEDHGLLYRVCAERWRALRAIEGPASDGDPYIEVYREAGGGYDGLQAIARAALKSQSLDAVSSHRDDEARETDENFVYRSARIAGYEQAVSDVVELVRFRGSGNIRTTSKEQASEDMADFIEKWAADRKAGT
jgi:hypothetical protein